MKLWIFICGLLVSLFIISGCGKVSNETAVKKSTAIKTYYTTLVGNVEVSSKDSISNFTLLPTENVLVVSLALLNKDGSQSALAWGKGLIEKTTTAERKENPFVLYKSAAFNSADKKISRESLEDIYIKWIDGDTPKFEYYIKYQSFNGAIYFVNLFNEDGSKYYTIPLDGKSVSGNTKQELGKASNKTTLWSRIFLADQSKNVVKKSNLTIAQIKNQYKDEFIATLNYKPKDIRFKKFNNKNPKIHFSSTDSMESYLAEALNQLKGGPTAYQTYLKKIPTSVVPTSAITIMKTFKKAPTSKPRYSGQQRKYKIVPYKDLRHPLRSTKDAGVTENAEQTVTGSITR